MKCVPHSVLNCCFFILHAAFYNINPETCRHSCTDSYVVAVASGWCSVFMIKLKHICAHVRVIIRVVCFWLHCYSHHHPEPQLLLIYLFTEMHWQVNEESSKKKKKKNCSKGRWINKGLWAFTRVVRRKVCVYFSWLLSAGLLLLWQNK